MTCPPRSAGSGGNAGHTASNLSPALALAHKTSHADDVLTTTTRQCYDASMETESHLIAEVNIHLRARAQDKALIDQAASLLGENRSQFMLSSALEKAKNTLLDQTTFYVDSKAFQKIMEWLDSGATPKETKGLKHLMSRKPVWADK